MTTDVQRLIDKAKIRLIADPRHTFCSTILFSLKLRIDEKIPTAATNGTTLWINPQFFMDMTAEERTFLLAHEAWHVAFQHMLRIGNRNHNLWNMAADYVINAMLIDTGMTMPKGGLYKPRYAGMTTEAVYDLLKDDEEEQAKAKSFQSDLEEPGEGEDGDGSNGNGIGNSKEIQRKLDDILIRASTQQRMAEQKHGKSIGQLPGEIQRRLDELLNPVLPWNQILQNYVTRYVPKDYSFRRPNRRFMPEHFLPTLDGYGMENLAVIIDTSGSVNDEMFQTFISEVEGIRQMLKPQKTTLIQFDWRIQSTTELGEFDPIGSIDFVGGGGTAIHEPLQWVKDHNPTVALLFTDGYFQAWDDTVSSDLIWLIYDNPKFEWPQGRVIEFPLEDKING